MSSHNVLVLATEDGTSGCASTALLQRCRDHEVGERWWVTLQGDSQLRVEHALNLTRADLCVFLRDETNADALADNSAEAIADTGADIATATATATIEGKTGTYSLRTLAQDHGHHMASSEGAITPEDLLHTLATLGRHGREPRCYVLELAPGASRDALDRALAFLVDLLEQPDATYWDSRLS